MATSAGAVVAAAAARARREVQEHFEQASAYDPDRAVGYEAPGQMQQRQVDMLLGQGILRKTEDGRYWIDREALQRENERRAGALKIVFLLVFVGIVIAAVFAQLASR